MLVAFLMIQVLILLCALLYFAGLGWGIFFGAPYVGTSARMSRAMLTLAQVKEGDVLLDLGCGLGNILYQALRYTPVERVVGYDINPLLIFACKIRCMRYTRRVALYTDNVLHMRKHPEVTVLTLYLLPSLMDSIIPVLIKQLPREVRIVAHGFAFAGVNPLQVQRIHKTTLRLYAMNDLIAAHTL